MSGGLKVLARSRVRAADLDVERLLPGLRTRRSLSQTIQIEVEQILARCRALDERLLGVTILKMIGECDTATASDDRQSALRA